MVNSIRVFLFLFVYLINVWTYAQDLDQKTINSVDLGYSHLLFKNQFEGLNNFKNYEPFSPIAIISYGLNAKFSYNASGNSGEPAYIILHYFIPDKLNYNDTLPLKVSGYMFGITQLGFDLFHKKENLDFLFLGGLNIGRVRLQNKELFNLRNSIFAPKITCQFRIKIKRIVFSLNAEYMIDISSKKWKKLHFAKSQNHSLPDFKQSGLVFGLSVGLGFD